MPGREKALTKQNQPLPFRIGTSTARISVDSGLLIGIIEKLTLKFFALKRVKSSGCEKG
jgi:hypothetical protein